MGIRTNQFAAIVFVCAMVMGCAVRLGGAKPEEYNAIAVRANATITATEMAGLIRLAEGDLVLLSADRDSTWFADVATQTGLKLNGPGRTGPSTLGFLTRLEAVGDTAFVLMVPSGGKLHIQDALFTVDKERAVDLMLVSFADVTSVRDGVRALLNYIATDVGGTSAVLLGIEAGTRVVADSAAALVRAAFPNALECGSRPVTPPASGLGVNLFYGPEARMSCESTRVLQGDPPAIAARVIVER